MKIQMNDFPFPCFELDGNQIVAFNDRFNQLFDAVPDKITTLIPGFDCELSTQEVEIDKRSFELLSGGESSVFFLVENKSGIAVGLIFIDNYDEALESVEEIRRPILLAAVDRKLNSYSLKHGGILKKFEPDKYLCIIPRNKLCEMKETGFEILSQIREIDMGNKIPVTLSIGIGVNGESPSGNMELSRAAIDLALGRGGDQALIKDRDSYMFFGGVARDIGLNTRVRARVKAYAFEELISEASNVIVVGHRNIDLDCIGAAVGVYRIVTAMGKECSIVLENITTYINLIYDRLVLEKEYAEKTFVSVAQAMAKISAGTLLVVVDAHRPSILDGGELLPLAKKIVVFDHHRKGAEFIDNPVLAYHEPYASSASELLAEMIQYLQTPVRLKPVEADALLAGITVDTKNFTVKTGAKTFEAAAYLRRNGADPVRVRMLFRNDIDAYRAKASSVYNAEIYRESIAISTSPSDLDNPGLTAAQAADELLNILGIQASFVLCALPGSVSVSARSLGDVNVQRILEAVGGGGHQTVAGAQITGKTIDECIDELKISIDNYLTEVKK